ncbi:16S rRNA (adenine(1518)-N(6)/adenine(1519)-N(6))-dimethyltransferase RsmA [Bifidobacterium sp. W8115]|uniref:16S rRNA (adenine(1518)-N(6)/adenine(1519)-N(6))- dimethyltransferase RsmA n=1 Tax=Bifidobacterium TaxID=1678 RepID=UPI0018DEB0E6|nr:MULTISPECIES: 16S rRNA (adenine(1518)-N(6)/adenine(1519)-N(6))-dimethyltransferase RsmA [Bifidobacterium]MBI0071596.1 16S rRNA (adenine(1518)-N(6)/adenine(1519)-N(6))-dimethyltransferase RsmA [Bifidobacterium sp. W8112]MBI0124591.1 16S rRNA (adenine(1518)-N(6)/adenine(1519)-N(6))-dimethyltransferase RsmA [Bifidobacterium apousia]
MNTRSESDRLLGAADIRRIADQAGIHPTKRLGQNFVIDPGTVRRIVRLAGVKPGQSVLEVGPGLGSLTLGLLEAGCLVTADEIDSGLAQRLPQTVSERMPEALDRLTVINRDALTLTPQLAGDAGRSADLTLVANLPYNVATPIILTLLARFANLSQFLVMVQKEVADRLTAGPGSKVYGAPSLKLAWYGHTAQAGRIGRHVFWPAPNVDSALVSFVRDEEGHIGEDERTRIRVFALIDAAFGQRRKTLHAALKGLVPPEAFKAAGIDPSRRGETMTIAEFAALERSGREVAA